MHQQHVVAIADATRAVHDLGHQLPVAVVRVGRMVDGDRKARPEERDEQQRGVGAAEPRANRQFQGEQRPARQQERRRPDESSRVEERTRANSGAGQRDAERHRDAEQQERALE